MLTLDQFKTGGEGSLTHLKEELSTLRTGRANAGILDGITFEAYGARMDLKSTASITVPDARTITIEPWDKTLLKEIEKAIQLANIGINPINDGTKIRLPLPPMTEESRKDLIKVVSQKQEQARISVRRARDEMKEKITAAEKEKTLTEDEKFRLHKELDELSKAYNDKIKAMGDEKEKEIMTI
ncbi:MAG: Ribosome-recycling factor [Candidatus Magasanikbacteria bacterium GW2011_GWA2_45_39]|uniref:Ribosome-recycling factor n=2 Tax=Candidatus Magasanikiibacteriota TaxID=1752731 RepID=A0A0G1MZM4_9BACT|nr:MAG: Ribosome-recycling factor [Candidatus Magasanikbacteria bacterium GW2011_GWA2_45_39]KKU13826.1 MAG: Ribosome-recycling factor [Candidatus Magasanikbacteria bacterium GW2011_GWC2_45_8]HBW74194.1 ribosome recycling factor [Candidatus Magasanikbacteria bacterium]